MARIPLFLAEIRDAPFLLRGAVIRRLTVGQYGIEVNSQREPCHVATHGTVMSHLAIGIRDLPVFFLE